jgi:hypothetical protein
MADSTALLKPAEVFLGKRAAKLQALLVAAHPDAPRIGELRRRHLEIGDLSRA